MHKYSPRYREPPERVILERDIATASHFQLANEIRFIVLLSPSGITNTFFVTFNSITVHEKILIKNTDPKFIQLDCWTYVFKLTLT